jgi:hypothetical protein
MDDHSIDDDGDDQMLNRIAAAFDRDLPPVPAALSDAARDAFQWRRADAILAELTFDSATDELVGVRGGGTERRSFRFSAGESVIRIHLTAATMIVMIEPPLSVACRVASGDGEPVEHQTDDYGELAVDAPVFPIRVEVDLPDGTVVTPWITA